MPYLDGEWVPPSANMDMKKFVKEGSRSGWASDTGFKFKSAAVVEDFLPSDIYKFEKTEHGLFFVKQTFPSDNPVSLPGLPSDYILNQIKMFWSKEETYKKYGLIHKRGILLYGTPGSGKTSIIRLLCNEILNLNGVVFCINDFEEASQFIAAFRQNEPKRPILTLQEDIEGLFSGSEGADQIKAALSFLDGQDQVNNIVHVATTNEPEKLADRFIKRPGRFDLVIGIHAPTAETREAYLRYVCKDQIPEEMLKELVQKTEKLGLAYLRELASTYLCLGIPLEETLTRLRDNHKKKVLKNEDGEQMGFTIGYQGSGKGSI